MDSANPPARFRHHAAITVAALITCIGAIPLVSAGPVFLPVLLVPLLVAWWAWWTGTDADADGLRLRAVLGQRKVPWSSVAELVGDYRGRAVARLVDGSELPLPAVPASGLTRLAAASGRTDAGSHHAEDDAGSDDAEDGAETETT